MKNFNATEILILILTLLIAIIGHEIMHGLSAYYYGDSTAKNQQRLSINPLKHIDMLGTLIIPALLYFSGGFLFGWAKPVPIDMRTVVKNGGYLGAINVSLAGIFYNLSLAFICSLFMGYTAENSVLYLFLYTMVILNTILGIFNLFPLPPLDGFQALGYILKSIGLNSIYQKMQILNKYGFIILIVIIATPLSNYFFTPMKYVINLMLN